MALSDAVPFAVAAYPLDEASGTRADSVGSNDLADNNTVGSAVGKFGNAADFTASSSESLTIADNATLSLGDRDFMFRCWFKAETLATFPVLFLKRDNAGGYNTYALFYHTGDNRLAWGIGNDSGSSTRVDWGSALSTGTWYLVHVWHDATNNQIGIAVNAGTAVTESRTTGVNESDGEFQVGAGTAQGLYWDGLIDDLVLLDGYILDATERTEDYNGGTGVAFADWDLTLADAAPFAVAHWTLDEASGTRADSVGSNDLTDNNTVGSAAGMFGNAADFESDNSEYLSITDNADLSTGDVDFMVRLWINPETLSGFPVIIHKGPDGNREFILYYSAGATQHLIWQVGNSGDVRYTAGLSPGTWYLIHAWHDSVNDEIGIAVNAGTAATASHAAPSDTNTSFELGAGSDQGLYFDGLIDDVVILKGYILNAAQRNLDYNSGTGVAFADWDGGGGVTVPALDEGMLVGGLLPLAGGLA